MSQEEILDVLQKEKKALSRGEIAKLLGDDPVHVSHSIARLIKNHQIKIIEINHVQAIERYNIKRRMRLYYI
jgi:TusA-related sulfurtransferase